MQRKTKSATQKQLRRSWSTLTWITALTHPQPQKSAYSSKKNYRHCKSPLSGFMRESDFQAQHKFSRKNQRSTEEITSHNFNFIRETQKEAFQKEYKALVSSTWTLSWMLFTCMTKRRGLTERDGNIELRELVEQLDQGKIVRTAANRRIKWGFNPPYALYFSTVHETMIKAAKRMKNWWLQSFISTDGMLRHSWIPGHRHISLPIAPITHPSIANW